MKDAIPPRLHRRSRAAGFTLLELLVAAAVFSLLAVLMARMIGMTSQSYRTEKNRLERERSARFSLSRLQLDLEERIARPDLPLFSGIAAADIPGFYSMVASPGGNRQLSAVIYRVKDQNLERGVLGSNWEGVNAAKFLPASFPSLDDSSFQVIAKGVVGLKAIYHKKSDGTLTQTLPDLADIEAITIAMAIVDEESLAKLTESQITDLTAKFNTEAGQLPLDTWWNNLYVIGLPSSVPSWVLSHLCLQQRTFSLQ